MVCTYGIAPMYGNGISTVYTVHCPKNKNKKEQLVNSILNSQTERNMFTKHNSLN